MANFAKDYSKRSSSWGVRAASSAGSHLEVLDPTWKCWFLPGSASAVSPLRSRMGSEEDMGFLGFCSGSEGSGMGRLSQEPPKNQHPKEKISEGKSCRGNVGRVVDGNRIQSTSQSTTLDSQGEE